ncbi:MAG: 50S ribosomal protein L30 [Candidatus Rhabdochlamydia sp.]|jgi:large subunit ribosomal protein L30
MEEKTIQIILRKSGSGRPPKHRRTLLSLGLRKIDQVILRRDTPEIRGMVRQIAHLVEVKE